GPPDLRAMKEVVLEGAPTPETALLPPETGVNVFPAVTIRDLFIASCSSPVLAYAGGVCAPATLISDAAIARPAAQTRSVFLFPLIRPTFYSLLTTHSRLTARPASAGCR